MNRELIKGLQQVADFAEKNGEFPVAAMLNAIMGAHLVGLDTRMCGKVIEFTKDVIMPETLRMQAESSANQN